VSWVGRFNKQQQKNEMTQTETTAFEISRQFDAVLAGGTNKMSQLLLYRDALKMAGETCRFAYGYSDGVEERSSAPGEADEAKHILYRTTRDNLSNIVFAIRHFYHTQARETLQAPSYERYWSPLTLEDMSTGQFGRLLGIIGATRTHIISAVGGEFLLKQLRQQIRPTGDLSTKGLKKIISQIEGTKLPGPEKTGLIEAANQYHMWSHDTKHHYRIRKRCAWYFHERKFLAEVLREKAPLHAYGPLKDMASAIHIRLAGGDFADEARRIKIEDKANGHLFHVPTKLNKAAARNIRPYCVGLWGDASSEDELVVNMYGKNAVANNNDAACASLFMYIRKLVQLEQAGKTIIYDDKIFVDLTLKQYIFELNRALVDANTSKTRKIHYRSLDEVGRKRVAGKLPGAQPRKRMRTHSDEGSSTDCIGINVSDSDEGSSTDNTKITVSDSEEDESQVGPVLDVVL
jgi:hypothetical protein